MDVGDSDHPYKSRVKRSIRIALTPYMAPISNDTLCQTLSENKRLDELVRLWPKLSDETKSTGYQLYQLTRTEP